MRGKTEIYQGSDWLTYRWTIAQAFDTLDRIRDLCLQMPLIPSTSPPAGQPRFEVPEEDIADLFGYIVELCDDLGGEMDTAHADLAPLLHSNMAHSWSAVEMRIHLKELRARALKEASENTALVGPPDMVLTLTAKIKTLLKQIDQ